MFNLGCEIDISFLVSRTAERYCTLTVMGETWYINRYRPEPVGQSMAN